MLAAAPSNHLHFAKTRLDALSRWGSRIGLLAVPFFFVLFFALLFGVWFLDSIGTWLAVAGVALVITMLATTLLFWLASTHTNPPIVCACVTPARCPVPDTPQPGRANGKNEQFPVRLTQMRTVDCSLCRRDTDLFTVGCFSTNCSVNARTRPDTPSAHQSFEPHESPLTPDAQ